MKLNYQVFPSKEKTLYTYDNNGHEYCATDCFGFENGKTIYGQKETYLRFVEKEDNGKIIPGLQSEQLAYILLDRQIKLNERFPSQHNEKAIVGLKMFLEAQEERVKDRLSRGVMGKLEK